MSRHILRNLLTVPLGVAMATWQAEIEKPRQREQRIERI